MEMGKPRKRRKQRKRKHQRLKQKATRAAAAAAGVVHPKLPNTGEIWSSTYTQLLQWHQTQVKYFCQQQQTESSSDDNSDNSADEEEEEELQSEVHVELDDNSVEQVDADYLEFLAVTLKHQEELKQMRAAQQTTTTAAEI